MYVSLTSAHHPGIFMVSAVMVADAIMRALEQCALSTNTGNIIQEDGT